MRHSFSIVSVALILLLAGAHAGAKFVIFSPAEVMAEVEAHMARRAQQLQSA